MKRTEGFAGAAAVLAAGLLAAGLAAGDAGGGAGAPAKVRLGYFPNITHAPALVGTADGSFEKALAPSGLEVKTFNAGPSLIEAVFADEIDIGYIGPNPAINGYVKSGGKALKIIAGSSSGGARLVVAGGSGILKAADFNGRKIATPQLGNTQDVALRKWLAGNGLKSLDKGGTVEVIPTQNANILSLFSQGRIDGAWVPEPWGSRLVAEGSGRVFLDERTLWPDGRFVTANVIVRTAFLEKHPGAVKKFLEAHVAAVRFINAERDSAKKIINKELERLTLKALPGGILDSSLKMMEITYDPVRSSLFKSADDAYELGFLGAKKPDISGIYALELLNEVLAEKGLEKVK